MYRFLCWLILSSLAIPVAQTELYSQESGFQPKKCQIVPLPDHEVSFQIHGVEKLRWHLGREYPRPFFFPLNAPKGGSLTRMGHPGAPNHDHHQSVWFAHNDVDGIDFWSNKSAATIRQKNWFAYEDGDSEAIMASALGWFDGEDREVMQQELVAALIPVEENEHALELQITFRPGQGRDKLNLGKTNFGFLGVRIAKSVSVHFGGGKLTNSNGLEDEKNIFGKKAKWVDYSGPVLTGKAKQRTAATAGVTYFDHPSNPRYPTHWHVREDGWMGAAFCLEDEFVITSETPLILRYLLHAHSESYDQQKARQVHIQFTLRPGFEVTKSQRAHRQFEVRRMKKKENR